MCKACYEEYLEVTGGTSNGADPPAFQKASQREVEASRSLCPLSMQKDAWLVLTERHGKGYKSSVCPYSCVAMELRALTGGNAGCS